MCLQPVIKEIQLAIEGMPLRHNYQSYPSIFFLSFFYFLDVIIVISILDVTTCATNEVVFWSDCLK